MIRRPLGTVLVPLVLCAAAALAAPAARAQEAPVSVRGDSVVIRMVDTDLRSAVQLLSGYLPKPVTIAPNVPQQNVFFETPRPVHRSEVVELLRALLENYGVELVEEERVFRVQGVAPAAQPARPVPSQRGGGAAAAAGELQLFSIPLRHARAADVAQTVNALYGRASALGEIGATTRSTLGDRLARDRIPPAGAPVQVEDPRAAAAVRGGFEAETVIVPDERTNTLLVRATPRDYQLILRAIEVIDVRPMQVLIEALLVEVSRSSGYSFGLGLSLDSVAVRGTRAIVERGRTTVADEPTVGGGLSLRVMGIGGVDLRAELEAAVRSGVASVVSRPVLFAANNQEAEIVVGDQRPFVQVQRTTDGGLQDQIVQYQDVGTRLNVIPTISGDGYVNLAVLQEVNAALEGTGVFDAPIIATRSLSTQLLVRDGQTVVLGGLADIQASRQSTGVPILSSIPVLGALFGRKAGRRDDRELFLFLTPYVVRDDEEMDALTERVREGARQTGRAARRAEPFAVPSPEEMEPGEEPAPGTETEPLPEPEEEPVP